MFMRRITEAIGELVSDKLVEGYIVSLNDSTNDLLRYGSIPAKVVAWGAERSKWRLVTHILTSLPCLDVLIVGHIGPSPVAYLTRKLRRAWRYYVILHGIEAWKRVSPAKQIAAYEADHIIATTQYTAQAFSRYNKVPIERLQVIPLCADERPISPRSGFRLYGGFKLLCVARQEASERDKGFEHIFHALARLNSTYPDIHLNLVGNGNDQSRLKRVTAELCVSQQVTFWGALSDEDLAAAYSDCDVFVMPSKKEGFGIVFLEAMRHGKPCIGGNHGGTPEVIEHGKSGYLVNYGDAEALAGYIAKLRQYPSLRAAFAACGRNLVEGRYSAAEFRNRYRKLILGRQ